MTTTQTTPRPSARTHDHDDGGTCHRCPTCGAWVRVFVKNAEVRCLRCGGKKMPACSGACTCCSHQEEGRKAA